MSENQSPTIGALILALSKAQGKFEGAAKSSDNPFFKSKYADLHECIEAAKPGLAENELAVIQTTDTDEKGIWVITTLGHSSGEWIKGRLLMKPKKDDDQGIGSSITYGRRYTFAAIVGLAQKDDDGNASCDNKADKGHSRQSSDKPKPPYQQSTTTQPEAQIGAGKGISGMKVPDVIKAIDAECDNAANLDAWWADNEPEVRKMKSFEQKLIVNHIAEKKSAYLAAPLSWTCPRGGQVTSVECDECAAGADCEVYKEKKP